MKITSTWKENISGLTATAEYEDAEDFSKVPYQKATQVLCFAFYQGKMLVVFDGDTKTWGLPGGGLEAPESFEDCAKRELQEEANMEMLSYKPIGFQKASLPDKPVEYQLRVFCQARPYGEFEKDPDGDVIKIKFINPKDYKKYFDWGKVSDRLIKRALSFLK